MSDHLAKTIMEITQIDPRAYENQLQKLYDQPGILHLHTELLSSNRPNLQKQQAASGVNYIILAKLGKDHAKWEQVWNEFQKQVLHHHQIQKVQWKHLSILSRGLEQLMFDMEEHLAPIFNNSFPHLCLKAKVLMFSAFLETQTTRQTQYIILRQCIEQYLAENIKFVCWLHEQSQCFSDDLSLEEELGEILVRLLQSLNQLQDRSDMNRVSNYLTSNHELFQLIVQWLLFQFGRKNYKSVRVQQFSLEKIKDIVFYSNKGTQKQQDHCNTLKASAFKILSIIVNKFDKKSEVQQFDKYKNLRLMEQLMPYAVQSITQLIRKRHHSAHQVLDTTIISLIEFIGVGCEFNFMLAFVSRQYQKLIFEIVYPLIGVHQEQQDQYHQNPRQFIRITEQMTENIEDKENSPRNSACELLEILIDTLNCLPYIVNINMDIIKYKLTNDTDGSIQKINYTYRSRLSVQSSLTMLTIISHRYLKRKELFQVIKTKLLDLPEVKQLKGLQQAKLMLFLAYNYTELYKNQQEQAADYLNQAARLLPENTTLGQCALLLFSNCIELGFGQRIWKLLLTQVEQNKSVSPLSALRKIASDKAGKLPLEYLQEMVNVVIARLINQYKLCEDQAGSNHKVVGGLALLQCLNIIEELTRYPSLLLQNDKTLIRLIWPVFDLFEFTQKIQFQDNILRIFNKVARAQPKLNQCFYKFLDKISLIVLRDTFDENTLETFNLLLNKGKQLFQSNSRLNYLQNVIDSLKACYSMKKKQQNLRHVCIFMQYIYYNYGQKLRKDIDFIDKIMEIYQNQKKSFSEQTLAAILNLFLTVQLVYGTKYSDVVAENSITIFKGYQAQVAALNFCSIIHKNPQEDYVIDFLRYCIRLLHFIKQLKANKETKQVYYYRPSFETINEIDAFQVVSEMLDYLKQQLEPSKYDKLIEGLKQEIHLGEVRDLLTHRQIGSNLRIIVRVRKDQ